MLENVLEARHCSARVKFTVKGLISAGLIALAVCLPQLVHVIAGAPGGVKWLPMYLPVLLGGCLLGVRWGLGIGILSPLVSFWITSAMGSAMPAAARLPFMVAELAVFGAVSGLFAKKIGEHGWMAFPAVFLAEVSGRGSFLLLVLLFRSVSPFTPAMIWSQILTGLPALLLQAVLVPLSVIGLKLLWERERHE